MALISLAGAKFARRARDRDGFHQPRSQGLSAFKMADGRGEDPGVEQVTCLQKYWRF